MASYRDPGGRANRIVEERVIEVLRAAGPQTIEQLVASMTPISWTEVFSAVDRLSRSGEVQLRRIDPCGYQVAIGPPAG